MCLYCGCGCVLCCQEIGGCRSPRGSICDTQVTPGDLIQTEKLVCDIGEVIKLKKVMLVATPHWTAIGKPLLEGAEVIPTAMGGG